MNYDGKRRNDEYKIRIDSIKTFEANVWVVYGCYKYSLTGEIYSSRTCKRDVE